MLSVWYNDLSGEGRGDIVHDTEFEGLATRELADGSLQAWVHHSPAILQQVMLLTKITKLYIE